MSFKWTEQAKKNKAQIKKIGDGNRSSNSCRHFSFRWPRLWHTWQLVVEEEEEGEKLDVVVVSNLIIRGNIHSKNYRERKREKKGAGAAAASTGHGQMVTRKSTTTTITTTSTTVYTTFLSLSVPSTWHRNTCSFSLSIYLLLSLIRNRRAFRSVGVPTPWRKRRPFSNTNLITDSPIENDSLTIGKYSAVLTY